MTSSPVRGIPFLGLCESLGSPLTRFLSPLVDPHASQTCQQQCGSFSLFFNQASKQQWSCCGRYSSSWLLVQCPVHLTTSLQEWNSVVKQGVLYIILLYYSHGSAVPGYKTGLDSWLSNKLCNSEEIWILSLSPTLCSLHCIDSA